MRDRGFRIAEGGWVAALALALAGGCAKRQSSMARPPEINPPPKVEASAATRVGELDRLSRQFEATAQRLPGRTPDDDRRIVQQAFAELAQVLPVLYGPNPTGTFRQQLRIVENARTQLASAPKGLAAEPTIDTGLRAANDALKALASRSYFDQAKLGQSIDRLDAAMAGLDTARGAAHQGAVADATARIAEVIRQMSDELSQRLADPAAPQAGTAPPEPTGAPPK